MVMGGNGVSVEADDAWFLFKVVSNNLQRFFPKINRTRLKNRILRQY
jgi:hypothetical protein